MAGHDRRSSTDISELKHLMAPESPNERALREEIRALRFYEVMRVSESEMAAMQMQPQQCHNNVAKYAALDSSGESSAVAGWLRRGDIFLFHSVIFFQSRLCCVTPHDFPLPLEFAPDPKIEWHDLNGMRIARRAGRSVPYLVRADPEKTIEAATRALEIVRNGGDLP